MNIEEIRNFCSSMFAAKAFPFDYDTLTFKVEGKIFLITSLKKWEEGARSINLKCSPDHAIQLREKYPDEILPAYHMNKRHWNSVCVEGNELSKQHLLYLVQQSYDLVVANFPKKIKGKFKN